MSDPNKILKAVVATVSLGVGVDIRVKNVVSFSLGSSPEDTLQEAGRCMRGTSAEVGGERGLAFFLQKGSLAAIHCEPSSDCRDLISDPLPKCQTETLMRFFDPDFVSASVPCLCCYSCIKKDAKEGCGRCQDFLEFYLSPKRRQIPSLLKDLRVGLAELFNGLGLKDIKCEANLSMSLENFSEDFLQAFDEISCAADIVDFWHIDQNLAEYLFKTCIEVMKRDENPLDVSTSSSEDDSCTGCVDDEDQSCSECASSSDELELEDVYDIV